MKPQLASLDRPGAHRLLTERLELTEPTPDDFDDSAAMWADPAVVRFIGGVVSTPSESWNRLLRYAGLWRLLGYGYFVVRERSNGRFVGELGLADFRRDMFPHPGSGPEAGWALAQNAQGRGFGREAMTAVMQWADAKGFGRTVCLINPDHERSIRLAGELGYQLVGPATLKAHDTLVFERFRG